MAFHPVSITKIEHHTERLLYLEVEKPAGFTFEVGQFVRLGVACAIPVTGDDDIVSRPYSITSGLNEDTLGFYIARVEDGELSGRFFKLNVGDTIYVDANAYGFMLPRRLEAGGTLMCFASGTGLASFLSVVKNNPWERFDNVVVLHCVKTGEELSLQKHFEEAVRAQGREVHFRFIGVTTRDQAGEITKRLPAALEDGDLEKMGFTMSPKYVRALICGNPPFVAAMKQALKARGFTAPRGETLGTYVAENF